MIAKAHFWQRLAEKFPSSSILNDRDILNRLNQNHFQLYVRVHNILFDHKFFCRCCCWYCCCSYCSYCHGSVVVIIVVAIENPSPPTIIHLIWFACIYYIYIYLSLYIYMYFDSKQRFKTMIKSSRNLVHYFIWMTSLHLVLHLTLQIYIYIYVYLLSTVYLLFILIHFVIIWSFKWYMCTIELK